MGEGGAQQEAPFVREVSFSRPSVGDACGVLAEGVVKITVAAPEPPHQLIQCSRHGCIVELRDALDHVGSPALVSPRHLVPWDEQVRHDA
jgi:hypothetical protein